MTAMGASGIAVLLALASFAPGEHREEPSALEVRAGDALRKARLAGAARRSPVHLAQAEEAYGDGLAARRRQDLRPGPFRDYRDARRSLASAVSLAEWAARLSDRSLDRERSAGTVAVANAVAALAQLEGVEDRVWLEPALRSRLQRARALASEGTTLMRDGAYVEAARRGRDARDEAAAVAGAILNATFRYADPGTLEAWRSWVAETVAWSTRTGEAAVVVLKDEHRLVLYEGGRPALTFDTDLGWFNVAEKRLQGDGATPEGTYRIVDKKGRGRSRYHIALVLDYPNDEDLWALEALRRSDPSFRGARPGGLVEIHGEGGRGSDWTDGCVALTNEDIEDLFRRVTVGTPVTIVGSASGSGVFGSVARRLAR
jgi:lipoprotein-anchoring transpeptidase ErfK/SrfK